MKNTDDTSESKTPGALVVVDLDGTLTGVNTWHFFARYLLRLALRRGYPFSAVALGCMLVLRKLKVISHRCLKRFFMLRSAAILNADDLETFADMMAGKFDPEVIALLTDARNNKNANVVLATAAVGEYAPLIGRRAGIADTLCTPVAVSGRPYIECRGERKADAVEQYARRRQLDVVKVITDHPDDLPLFRRFPAAEHILIKR